MKYEIDTMPVWDALKANSECPLCLLEKRSRTAALRYYLGPSVMAPEVRVQVNARGFSPDHWRLLAKDPNKLGLALLSHTRLQTIRQTIQKKTQTLRQEAQRLSQKAGIAALGASKAALRQHLTQWIEELQQTEKSCLITAKINQDLARYSFTLIHLWKNDAEFRTAWQASKGLCLRHTPTLLEMAPEELNANQLGVFIEEFMTLQEQNLERIERDVLSFTQTFDSTHSHTPTGDPAGALDRSLQKMAGTFAEYEEEGKNRRGPLMGTVSG